MNAINDETMTLTASINPNVLDAVNLAASNEEARYYLNGVLIEVTETQVRYVATNGHIMLHYRETSHEPNSLTGSWIIPLAWIKKNAKCLCFKAKIQCGDNVAMTLAGELLKFTGSETVLCAPIDGTFPDWRRLVPRAPGEGATPQQFNGDYYATFTKYAKQLGLDAPAVHHRNDGPCPVTFGDRSDTFGLFMPVYSTPPAWVREAYI